MGGIEQIEYSWLDHKSVTWEIKQQRIVPVAKTVPDDPPKGESRDTEEALFWLLP